MIDQGWEQRQRLVFVAARRLLDVSDDAPIEDLKTAVGALGIDVDAAVARVETFVKEYPRRLMAEAKLRQEAERKAFQRFQQQLATADVAMLQEQVRTMIASLPPKLSDQILFRDLAPLDYLSSFTHAGRYYTLRDLASFDEHGLWVYDDIGFSRVGTLKESVATEVEESETGHTHLELARLLRVRVHNTLLDLVGGERIARHVCAGRQLYVSGAAGRAAVQIARREAQRQRATALSLASTMAVLAEALRLSRVRIDSATLTARLRTRGETVTAAQVETVLVQYGIAVGKKTVPSRSPRWRR